MQVQLKRDQDQSAPGEMQAQMEHSRGARTSRILLAAASLLSALGAAIHAAAFRKATPAIDASNLLRFYRGCSKALWLADSTTLLILAIIFGVIAARPLLGTRVMVILVALIPAATAILLYTFLGNFPAGHLLLTIATLAVVAGIRYP